MAEVLEIPLSKIVWKSPIREEISREDVENMSTSFMVHGQIHPIVVTPPDENGMHEGVCGRLRYLGARRKGLSTILARVRKFEDEEEKLEWQLAENLHRRDIPVISKSDGYTKLKRLVEKRLERETGKKPSEKAVRAAIVEEHEKLTGEKKAEETVRQYLRIHDQMPDEVKKVVTCHQIGLRRCIQLLRVKDPKLQLWLAEEAGRKGWSVNKLRKTVSELEKVSAAVKEAVVSYEMSVDILGKMGKLYQHQQDRVLGVAKQKGWTPKTTKAVIDLILQKPEELDRVLSLPEEDVLAELKGEKVVRTSEELREFFKGLVEMPVSKWEKVHHCPKCGTVLKINWEEGSVEWQT